MAIPPGRSPLHRAQSQVVVLASLVAQPEAADRLQQGAPVDAEMADDILPAHQVRVPVRLE